jgi:DEAD/DEAH box helicase domain-containing protein
LPFPAKHVHLRGAEEEKYLVVNFTKEGQSGGPPIILEEVEFSRALFELYEGAVVRSILFFFAFSVDARLVCPSRSHIHSKCSMCSDRLLPIKSQVKELSHDTKMAKVFRADVSWITTPRYVCMGELSILTGPQRRDFTLVVISMMEYG